MSSGRTNWLSDTPTSHSSSGGGVPNTYMLSPFITNWTGMINFYNFMATSTFADTPGLLFTTPREWVSRVIWFPFTIPIGGDPTITNEVLKVGPLDTGTLGKDKKVEGWLPLFNIANKLISLGKTKIERKFNDFMDYNGYTKIEVYLPYSGIVEVQPNDVMGKYLHINLYIDYYTGQGIYYLSVTDNDTDDLANARVILKHEVKLGYEIPIGSTNAASTARNLLLGTVKSVGMVAAAGFLSHGGKTYESHKTLTTTESRFTPTGRLSKTPMSRQTTSDIVGKTQYQVGDSVIASMAIGSSIGSLNNMDLKASSDRVNNPVLDMATSKVVKVVIKRPRPIAINNDYNKIYGKPAAYTAKLSTLKGYTQITGVHLEGFKDATIKELDKIDKILKTGVII